MSDSKIYQMIHYLCEKNGTQIGDLEKAIGISTGYISRTRTGNRRFSLETALKIAEYFNISIDELIKGPPEKTNADVFMEIFGFHPSTLILRTDNWWNKKYINNDDI